MANSWSGLCTALHCRVQLIQQQHLHSLWIYESQLCFGGKWKNTFYNFFIFTSCASTTGTHLQVDEEWFIQPFHPFQCLPGVITGQEEGKKHIAWLKTLDKCFSLNIRWDAGRTRRGQHILTSLLHRLFSLGDAETCPPPQSRLVKVCQITL